MSKSTISAWSELSLPSLSRTSERITVNDAVLSTFGVKKVNARYREVTGAVYQDGELLQISQRIGGRGGDLVTSVDPKSISGSGGFNRLSGRWLYAGNWMGQFGHFITETLTTLWARDNFDGIIAHPFIFGNAIHPWQIELVRRLGFNIPILIANQGCIVDQLVVSERPFVLNESVAAEAVNVWNRVASPGIPSRDFFLSRSKLSNDARKVNGDERLDNVMESLGYEILHPQDLTMSEQLDVIADSRVLAGVSGSALHLSAFTSPLTKILELGDQRTHSKALPNQRVIDDAAGRQSGFVPFIADGDVRNIHETERCIHDLLR